LYGNETSSFTERELHWLKVAGNIALSKIFGRMRDTALMGWRKLHNNKAHNFCSSSNIGTAIRSKGMKWSERVRHMRDEIWIQIFVGEPEGKRLLGRQKHR
jgi:hypothetical protein